MEIWKIQKIKVFKITTLAHQYYVKLGRKKRTHLKQLIHGFIFVKSR